MKIQCRKATDLQIFMKFYESYKSLYMPTADNSFQKKLSHNWLWRYSEFIEPEIRTQLVTPKETENNAETQLDAHFSIFINILR